MHHKKIIISEGAMFLRAELKEILADVSNIQIIEASSANETSQQIAQEKPDVVLINVDLCRGLNGFSVAVSLEQQRELKIIVIGTVDNFAEVENLLAQGAEEYLLRPFEAGDLKSKLNAVGISSEG